MATKDDTTIAAQADAETPAVATEVVEPAPVPRAWPKRPETPYFSDNASLAKTTRMADAAKKADARPIDPLAIVNARIIIEGVSAMNLHPGVGAYKAELLEWLDGMQAE